MNDRLLNKTVATMLLLLLVLPMVSILNIIPTYALPMKDLTPDYAKAGATIDILSFDIVGPPGGTTLTSVTVAYTGNDLADLSWAAVYVYDGVSWTLFGWAWAAGFSGTPPTTTISGSYFIGEGVTVTVKLTFKLSSTAKHGHMVDGKVTYYSTTIPPGIGTDAPPIDPEGETIIDTSEPTVTLTYPVGGEELKGGETITITWSATDNDDFTEDEEILINLEYSPNGGVDWFLIASNEENDGEYEWTLPAIDSDSVLVRVWAFDLAGNSGSDTSDPFTIDSTSPTISGLTPADGAYVKCATPTISAVLSDNLSGINPGSITIEVDGEDVTGYAVWEWIEEPYSGTLTYTPTEDLGEGGHTVHVYVEDDVGNSADATWSFTVDTTAPEVVVIQPNGGEELIGGETYEIKWTAEDLNLAPNPITIEYSTDGGGTWEPIASNLLNTGSYEWVVPGVISNKVLVKVSAVDLAGNMGSDTSDAPFTITYIPVVTKVTVLAEPIMVPADGVTESTITATVLDQRDKPMKGVTVYFTTTLGTLSAPSAITDGSGLAKVKLTSTARGTATVTAMADSISGTVEVYFYGAAGIEDVIDMLVNIKSEIEALEGKFHEGGSFWVFISGSFTTIQNEISSSTSNILEAISALEGKLDDAARWVSDADLSSAVSTITSAISDSRSAIVSAITTAESDILSAISNLSTQLSGAVDSIIGSISSARSDIISAIDSAKSEIAAAIDSAKSDIISAISGLDAKLGSFAGTDTVASLLYDIKGAIVSIEDSLVGVELNVGEILDNVSAIEAKLDALPAWGDLVTKSWADLTSALSGVVSSIQGSIASAKSEILSAISGLGEELGAIEGKIDTLPAARVSSGGGTILFTASGSTVIYEGAKVGSVTVSIRTSGLSYGEAVYIRYYLDPANPTVYIEKMVIQNRDIGAWTDTAAAWKIEIRYIGTGAVYWAYSAIYPP